MKRQYQVCKFVCKLYLKFKLIYLENCINVVSSPRVAESKFSLLYSLLITMYRHRTTGWFARERKIERARERVVRRFSARWASLCSEVKRTVQARLSSSPIPRLHFAAVYSSSAKDDSTVLQSSFSQIPITASLFSPSALFYSPSSRGFILQRRIFLLLIIKLPLFGEYHLLFLCSQVPLLIAVRSRTCVLIHYTHSQLFSHHTCIRISLSFLRFSRLFQFPSSSSILILSFSPSAPLSQGAIYESERYGVSSTVICLRRLIMAALLLSWISTSY